MRTNRSGEIPSIVTVTSAVTMLACLGVAGPISATPPVQFPHPLITEVLYAVPTGKEGDADQDGSRSATGDEFVELFNPHDRPIQLKGYVICDGTPEEAYDKKNAGAKGSSGKNNGTQNRKQDGKAEKKSDKPGKDNGKSAPAERSDGSKTSLRFVFPEFELRPGEVVVLFNGYEQNIPGPVGTRDHAPAGRNEKFGNAWVFTMGVESRFVAFNNKGDCVAVNDPSGSTVEVVTWGKPSKEPPAALLTEKAPEAKGSVQRAGLTAKLVEHEEMTWSKGGGRELFSPGVFDPSFTPIPRGAGTGGKDTADPKTKPSKAKAPTDASAEPAKK